MISNDHNGHVLMCSMWEYDHISYNKPCTLSDLQEGTVSHWFNVACIMFSVHLSSLLQYKGALDNVEQRHIVWFTLNIRRHLAGKKVCPVLEGVKFFLHTTVLLQICKP